MIDPQPLSDDISHHEVRSAFGRAQQDLAAINSVFTGLSDSAAFTPGIAGSNLILTLPQERTRITEATQYQVLQDEDNAKLPDAGAAVRKHRELLAKIKEVNEDTRRSRAIFEQRMQSITKGRPR